MPINTNSQESLVSVIIPTYNRPDYLKAIGSAVQQQYRNIEIIVSDDCSPESPKQSLTTFKIHDSIPAQSEKFRIALNFCSYGGTRIYVASLNDDDLWNEDFLEKLVPNLDANQI